MTKRRLQLIIRINDECWGWQGKDYEDFVATNRRLKKKRTLEKACGDVNPLAQTGDLQGI